MGKIFDFARRGCYNPPPPLYKGALGSYITATAVVGLSGRPVPTKAGDCHGPVGPRNDIVFRRGGSPTTHRRVRRAGACSRRRQKSLPLMREVAKIYLIFAGGRETNRESSLPQSACSADSPLIRGGLSAHLTASVGAAYVPIHSRYCRRQCFTKTKLMIQK